MEQPRAVGYIFLESCSAGQREWLRRQRLERLTELFRRLGVSHPVFYVDEAPASPACRRRELERLLRRLEADGADIFAAAGIHDLGDGLSDCLTVLKTLADHTARVILMDQNLDSGSI